MKGDNIKLIFGLKLKQLRLDSKMSLAELSQKTGISVSYLNEIEKGKKYPKADKIMSLAEALGTDYDKLVSLQLSKKLSPVTELLKSNILNDLPLNFFGIDSTQLIELLSNAPTKLSAFVSTLIEISRNYGMQVENFYFSVLRSYQEMHENYFEDLENLATEFTTLYKVDNTKSVKYETLISLLETHYGYKVTEDTFESRPELSELRSLYIKEKKELVINANLNPKQKAFILAKELGFCFMQITERPHTATWTEVNSFEQVLNNFKASYFSCALMINRDKFVKDLTSFFALKKFDGEKLVDIKEGYHATTEMFVHRITNVLPKFFGIKELFFLKFKNQSDDDTYLLTKELHLSGLHFPHATVLDEHYCRRWLSLDILNELQGLIEKGKYDRPICKAQISRNITSDLRYLMISFARPMKLTKETNLSISIGLIINDKLKKKVNFIDDKNIKSWDVNNTCERCNAKDCSERVSPPYILEKEAKVNAMKKSIRTYFE